MELALKDLSVCEEKKSLAFLEVVIEPSCIISLLP